MVDTSVFQVGTPVKYYSCPILSDVNDAAFDVNIPRYGSSHNYICSNCWWIETGRWAFDEYDNDYMIFRKWRFSISEKKWILFYEYYGTSDLFYVNAYRKDGFTASVSEQYVGIDSIHFDFEIVARGVDDISGGPINLRMGTYCLEKESDYNTYVRHSKIYGKSNSGITGGTLLNTTEGHPSNPFLTTWGSVSVAEGTKILASDPYRLIALPQGFNIDEFSQPFDGSDSE